MKMENNGKPKIQIIPEIYERVYLPQMCNMNTDAMNSNDITKTGTGPTL